MCYQVQFEATAGFERSVNGVEVVVAYDEWERPRGIPEEDGVGSIKYTGVGF